MILDSVKNILYFDSTRNYTLALLKAFDGVEHFVEKEIDGELKTQSEKIPIAFANYEKFMALSDVDNSLITNGNYNFLPRMSLSFEGLEKDFERVTNKFNKFSKKYEDSEGNLKLDMSYNSVPYLFNFSLNIQARGVTQAFQIVERILPYFRPTMPLSIEEFPLIPEWVHTQVKAQDPSFEILDSLESTDINIVNVSIPLSVRGNIYSPISLSGPVNTVLLNSFIYENRINQDKMALEYRLDKDENEDWEETKNIHYAPPK